MIRARRLVAALVLACTLALTPIAAAAQDHLNATSWWWCDTYFYFFGWVSHGSQWVLVDGVSDPSYSSWGVVEYRCTLVMICVNGDCYGQ
jgi:hypothetical protein